MFPPRCKFLSLLLVGASCMPFCLSPAHAQTIDYSTLEQMFREPITTSATGQAQRARDVPANMVIITQDDIRRSGADNIPDILRYITGIDVATSAIAGSDVGVRGFNQTDNPDLLVLIDGREVYLDDYGYVDWGALPVALSSIRQIEVVKGPNSALFGFNAVSGVINIITYDPLLDHENSVTGAGGTQNLREAYGVVTVHPNANSGVRFSGDITRQSEYAPYSSIYTGAVGTASNWSGFLDAEAKFRATNRLILGLGVTMEDGEELSAKLPGAMTEDRRRNNSIRLTADADTAAGAIAVNIYHNEYDFNPGASAVQLVDSKYVAQLSDTAKLNANNVVRIGIEFRRNAVTGSAIDTGKVGYDDVAASAMWDWRILPSLSFTNAFRADFLSLFRSGAISGGDPFTNADYNSTRLTGYSYNSGLVYRLSGNDTFRLLTARGLQLPSLVNFGSDTNESIYFYGSPRIVPSVLTNYELDYNRSIRAINGSAGIAIYHERLVDILAGPFDSAMSFGPYDVPYYVAGNFGNAKRTGVEVTLMGRTGGGIRYNLGYTTGYGEDHTSLEPAGHAPLGNINFARSAPRDVVTGGLGITIGEWEMDTSLRYQTAIQQARGGAGGFGAPNVLVTIPAYVSASARVGYRVSSHITVAVTAQQALSPALAETVNQKVGRRIIGSATGSF